MATLTAKRLDTRALAVTTPAVAIYTVPASTKTRLTELVLCNTSGTSLTVRVHFVPSGGAADQTNAMMYDFPVDAGVPFILPLNTWLNTGDSVRAQCQTAAVMSSTLSGIEEGP